MATGTVYNPQNISQFEKSKLNKDGFGVAALVTAGESTNIDLVLSDDILIASSILLVNQATQGDTVDFQVLYGDTIVAQFITNWYLNPGAIDQRLPTSTYPAKLTAGLKLRLIYHSVGESDVWVAINYDREKVLV